MEHLIGGLASLVSSLQRLVYISLQIMPDRMHVVLFQEETSEVIDFKNFYWDSEEEKSQAIRDAIHYVADLAVESTKSTKEFFSEVKNEY